MIQTQQNFAEVANFFIGVTLLDANGEAYRFKWATNEFIFAEPITKPSKTIFRINVDNSHLIKPQLRPFYSLTQQEAVELALLSGEYENISKDSRSWTKHVFVDLNQVVVVPNTIVGFKPYIIGAETRFNSKQFAMLCKWYVDVFGVGK